jgi:alkylresorcinol/alkylpyrone synthase
LCSGLALGYVHFDGSAFRILLARDEPAPRLGNDVPTIRSVARALPAHYADQEQLIAVFRDAWAKQHFNVDRLEDLHRAVGVAGRHLALPLAEYTALESFEARNTAWTKAAVELGEQAVRAAVSKAGLHLRDLSHIFFVTVTGLATPSIDARLCNRLELRTDIKRTPIFGLG